jgi:hypothetical protein
MSLETLFSAASTLALAGWLLLILVPRYTLTQRVAGLAIPISLSAAYLVIVATALPGAEGGFGSLADVSILFAQPAALLGGWIHYLAFDLFIGGWETRDAARHGVPHLLVIPCLLLTFLLGPIGLLSYLAVRGWRARSLDLATA